MINLETYYLSGLPIPLQDKLGSIHPLTVRYMLENEIDYNEFLKPFLVRVDILENPREGVKDFDIFFERVGDDFNILMSQLVKSLKVIYKTDSIKIIDTIKVITIDDKFMIHRDNFTYLSDVVLEMMYAVREKPKKKEKKYKNKQLQATWEKLQMYRKKEEKKKAMQLADILNVLIHISNRFDYDKVLDLTYYQVMNSYLTLSKKEGYKEFMMFKTSGQFKMEKDEKNWMLNSKVKKSVYSKEEE